MPKKDAQMGLEDTVVNDDNLHALLVVWDRERAKESKAKGAKAKAKDDALDIVREQYKPKEGEVIRCGEFVIKWTSTEDKDVSFTRRGKRDLTIGRAAAD